MNIKNIIYNLRQRPESWRRKFLHFAIIFLGIILFLLWVYTLGSGLSSEETRANIENDLVAPMSAIKANLIDGYESVSDSFYIDLK